MRLLSQSLISYPPRPRRSLLQPEELQCLMALTIKYTVNQDHHLFLIFLYMQKSFKINFV